MAGINLNLVNNEKSKARDQEIKRSFHSQGYTLRVLLHDASSRQFTKMLKSWIPFPAQVRTVESCFKGLTDFISNRRKSVRASTGKKKMWECRKIKALVDTD